MKKTTLFLVLFSMFFFSCKTSKSSIITSKAKAKEKGIYTYDNKNVTLKKTATKSRKKDNFNPIKFEIVATAKENLGVKYKLGGTTKSGMDCSGLVYATLLKHDIEVARTAIDIAKEGREVSKSKAQIGDLIFFRTENSSTINHVGIITSIDDDTLFFIHASTSKGVIISALDEPYYLKAFAKIKRIIE